VYAGAIMVLFLFVVMMLNLREPEEIEEKSVVWKSFGVVVGAGLGIVLLAFFATSPGPAVPPIGDDPGMYAIGQADYLGKALFTDYVLPFEIAGVLLLATVLGAVALAKKKRV